jgi:hypothetical protein
MWYANKLVSRITIIISQPPTNGLIRRGGTVLILLAGLELVAETSGFAALVP